MFIYNGLYLHVIVFIYFESVGFILFGTYLVNIDMYDNSENNYTNAV